jgi:peptidyl-prolyl cis-trans isomerase D
MAAIGTIRKYSGIAVGFIGISILAFVISDGLGTGSSIFGGNDEVVVGEMAGHTITYQDFENRFNQELETLKSSSTKKFC